MSTADQRHNKKQRRCFGNGARQPEREAHDVAYHSSTASFTAALPQNKGSSVKMHQKSIKIQFPSPSVFVSFLTSVFYRFLFPTSTPWISKKVFSKKPPFEDNIDFGFDFGANLPPCRPPKSKIFRNYGLPRGLQNFIVFWASIFYRF